VAPRWILLVIFVCGCAVKQLPPEPPPAGKPLGVSVPKGCDADLSGLYFYGDADAGENPYGAWHYFASDDAGVLTLSAYRAETDAGPPAATVVLRRGNTGFTGEVLGKAMLPSGEECDIKLPAEVRACDPKGLLLASQASTAVGEGCQTPPQPRPAPLVEHRLTRADAGVR
jgi:hypothetical protein